MPRLPLDGIQGICSLSRTKMRLLCGMLVWGLILTSARADDWPQWLGPKRDGVWRETGILEQFPKSGPKVLWRSPVGGGYSGPAVAGNRVFITDRILPRDSQNPANGFTKNQIPGKERVLCLDDADGKIVWTHSYDCTYDVQYPSGPRTTPVVHVGKVYTLGTMGDLFCLDASEGKVIWSKNFPQQHKDPIQIWGFSAHPLVDSDKLHCLVAGDDTLVVALPKDT